MSSAVGAVRQPSDDAVNPANPDRDNSSGVIQSPPPAAEAGGVCVPATSVAAHRGHQETVSTRCRYTRAETLSGVDISK